MRITAAFEGTTLLLSVSGELTTPEAEKLDTAIEEYRNRAKKIILDFKEVKYIASAGLRVILHAKKELAKHGGALVIRGVCEEVMNIFEITGLSELLDFE